MSYLSSTIPQIQPRLARCQAVFCNCLEHLEEHLHQKDLIPILNISQEKNQFTYSCTVQIWELDFLLLHLPHLRALARALKSEQNRSTCWSS